MPDKTTAIDRASRQAATPAVPEGQRQAQEPPATLASLPLMLTVGEAAVVLRVSRTSAYKLAEEWRSTRGASGLPTVRLGSRVVVRRVDRAAIVGLDPAD